jgi:hypothetical protein
MRHVPAAVLLCASSWQGQRASGSRTATQTSSGATADSADASRRIADHHRGRRYREQGDRQDHAHHHGVGRAVR